MNTMEFNKFFGAGAAALLVFLLAGLFSESVFALRAPSQPGYALEIASAEAPAEAAPEVDLATLLAAADPDAGATAFRKCAACHKVEDGANGVGPNLHQVVGRAVGAVDGFRYSGALTQVAEVWGFDELNAFLTNPKAYAPGTSMGFAGLSRATERADVIVYLNTAGGSNLPLPEPDRAEVETEAAPAVVEQAAVAAPEAEVATEDAPAAETVAEAAAEPEPEVAIEAPAEAAEATTEVAAEAPTEAAAAPAEAAEAAAEGSDAPSETAEAQAGAETATPQAAEPEVEVAAVSEVAPEAAPEAAPATKAADAGTTPELVAALTAAGPDDGARVFRKCGACHRIEPDRHGIGPSLHGVVGRPVAAIEGFKYSDAMRAKGGEWTFDALNEYLERPRDVVPGTRMVFNGLRTLEERAALIAYLNEAGGSNLPIR